ncbi:MAG TPA: ABC transporter ATP-binding protein [Thermoplasmatales archaeon]|nr:ABC transporter ATP-binding protein [Thermoplasmatales archaeon]
MVAVEVRDLVKKYRDTIAVRGVSFDVKNGEIFGIIGPNGAGKTTILRILSTLLKVTSGSVKILGYDVEREAARIRKLIGYLPEDAGAYGNLTGREYLRFIANFFTKEKVDEMVDRGVSIAKLGGRIDDKIESYSKGMKRRLLIGRTLMSNPRLAILDEPTAGLDVQNAQEVRRIIKDSVRNGTTVVLSSHNMLEVEYLCDRIILLNMGVIVEEGSPSGLMERYQAKNIEEVFMSVVS